jgi:hypothetical protein
MTRLLGISLTMTSNHLYKHGTLKMGVALRKAIYAKMMQQDMSHFEQKFKKKDQARVMINVYLSQKVSKETRLSAMPFNFIPTMPSFCQDRLVTNIGKALKKDYRFLIDHDAGRPGALEDT